MASEWLIVGHGALASLWAHHLSAQHHPVRIITRAKTAPGALFFHRLHPQNAKNAPGASIFHRFQPANERIKHWERIFHSPSAHTGQSAITLTLDALANVESKADSRASSFSNSQSNSYPSSRVSSQLKPQNDITRSDAASANTTITRTFPTSDWQQVHQHINAHSRILVMVKAWQLQSAIEQLATAIERADCIPEAIILSHNGIGAAQELLAEKLQQGWPVFDLITTHGAWRKSPNHVVHAGAGQSIIGPRVGTQRETATGETTPWFAELERALPPLEWDANILMRRWHKLAINCAINPLATLAQQPNGVLADARYHCDIRAICEEIAAVAARVFNDHEAPTISADALEAQVHQVIHATASNTCSMLQDIQHHNPTEIEFLNGYIARLAAEYQLPAPVNTRLTKAIIALQSTP